MSEADLSAPVSTWLIAQGCTPYAEVFFPHCNRMIDLVGRRQDRSLVIVEMKLSLTGGVIRQAYITGLITNERYAAVGTKPSAKGIAECARLGIGLLAVNGQSVNVILSPRDVAQTDWVRIDYETEMHKNLDVHTPHGTGGLPTRKGEGPAQDCYDRIILWRAVNPTGKWRNVYEQVPHHYCSVASLQSAMRIVAERRAKAERVRAEKATNR